MSGEFHWRGLLVKSWTALQPMALPERRALYSPPEVGMCAPSKRPIVEGTVSTLTVAASIVRGSVVTIIDPGAQKFGLGPAARISSVRFAGRFAAIVCRLG